jgi:hypothetical protein
MDPGKHDLSLLPAGGPERRRTFELREGERSELLLSIEEAPPPSAQGVEAAPASDGADRSRRTWAYVAGGAGIAGLALGAVTGIITLQKKGVADRECSDATRTCSELGRDANESGRRFGLVSSVGFGVGVVGLAAGAYLLLTSPSSGSTTYLAPPPKPDKIRAELVLEGEAGFLAVAGRF